MSLLKERVEERDFVYGGRQIAAFFAAGIGGQYIFVIPAVDLVVVVSSESERRSGRPQKELLTRFVLPAILDRNEMHP